MYFVIYQHGTEANCMTFQDEEKLLGTFPPDGTEYLTRDDLGSELAYWGENACLVIKGSIIQPKKQTVVTEWTIEEV